jgi:hypothetical protein
MKAIHIPIIALFLLIVVIASCKQDTHSVLQATVAKRAPADQVNYYLLYDSLNEIKADTLNAQNAQPYNNSFVVSPGIYKIGTQALSMKNEGLYRILMPFQQNYQVVVYKKDVITLLSSISWIITHGTSDDGASFDSLIQKAKNDKIYITCEKACNFAKQFLSMYDVQSRLIQGRALDKPNGYDEGHVMLEVLLPDTKKWMLFDIDNNAIFKTTNGNEFLNLLEFKNALDNNDLQIVDLSLDKKVDISQFKEGDYSFSFYSESITASRKTLQKWYRRILGVVLIDNHHYNPDAIDALKYYSNSCVYLNKDSFKEKFYSQQH